MVTTPDRSPAESDDRSRLRLTEIDRDWALRRLELFKSLNGSVQQALGTVLEVTTEVVRTADGLRQEMEQQASDLIAQLRSEREALLQEIQEQRRQRDALSAEMGDLRGRAEETEARRREVEQELTALRQQTEQEIATARQRADGEIAAMRRQAEAERDRLLDEAQTRRAVLIGEIQDLERQLAAVASQLQAMVTRPPPGAGRGAADGRPTEEPGGLAPGPVARKAAARLASPDGPRPAPLPGTSAAPPPPAANGPSGPGPTAEASAAGRTATALATAPSAATTPAVESRVTVRHISAFSSALELQRSIQSSPGVRDVRALQFENGVLVLAVEHDAGLDLAGAMARLPIQTELLAQARGRLELTVATS
jgi:hypothetical protein